MKNLEARLLALEDRAALGELVAHYAMLVAQGDGPGLAALFTPDGRFRAGAHEATGADALLRFFSAMKPTATIPLVGNLVLSIDGDDAEGRSTLFARVPGETLTAYSGRYADRFRRVAGAWKFVSRDFTFYHDQAGKSGTR